MPSIGEHDDAISDGRSVSPEPVNRISSTLPNSFGHIPALDSVRGLAILMVTVFRFGSTPNNGAFDDSMFQAAVAVGMRGVDLFFVLSGFLITGILLDAQGQPHYFRNFYLRRAVRIFPLYFGVLVALIVVLPAVSESAAERLSAREHQWWLWFYGVNLWQAWTASWPFGCLNHFWSLAVEEHFYLVWPLVIYLCDRRRAIWACGFIIVLSFAARFTWLLCGGNDVAAEVFTLFRADQLAIGGLLAILIREPGFVEVMKRWAPSVIGIGVIALVAIGVSGRRCLGIPDTIYACVFACLVLAAVTAPSKTIVCSLANSQVLQFFGKYSYGLYVFQNPLIPATASFISVQSCFVWTGNPFAARVLYVAVMTAIATLIAVASWHLFESHFLKLKRYFPLGLKAHRSPKPATSLQSS